MSDKSHFPTDTIPSGLDEWLHLTKEGIEEVRLENPAPDKYTTERLNPDTEGAYSEESIELYYLIEGEKVSAYEEYYIGVDLSTYKDDKEQSITDIALNESDTDTIICTYRPGTNLKRTVHYNGVLIWNSESDNRVPRTIVK